MPATVRLDASRRGAYPRVPAMLVAPLAFAALAAAPAAGQAPRARAEPPLAAGAPAMARGSDLFRNPGESFPLPEELIAGLERMRRFAERHRLGTDTGHTTYFDEEGREDCTDPEFQRLRREMSEERLVRRTGHLGKIILEHRDATARRAAFYGGFFVPSPQETLQLVALIPGEPVRDIRYEALRLALPFLDRWLPPREQEEEGAPELDVEPFQRLMASPYATDRVWALAVLERVLLHRRHKGLLAARAVEKRFVQAVESGHEALVAAARRYLATLAGDEAAGEGEPEALVERYRAEIAKAFPALRAVSEGLVELHSGPELEQAVEVGRRALERGTLGAFGELPPRRDRPFPVRGLVLAATVRDLPVLGLAPGDVVTAVNGTPVFSCDDLLRLVRGEVERGVTTFMVEFFARGEQGAREFRLVRP